MKRWLSAHHRLRDRKPHRLLAHPRPHRSSSRVPLALAVLTRVPVYVPVGRVLRQLAPSCVLRSGEIELAPVLKVSGVGM